MKPLKNTLLLFVALILASCAAPSSMINKISVGMTKQQVIKAMGNPVSVSAQTGTEMLNYSFIETPFDDPRPYYVRLREGKVESYGRLGDFDSQKIHMQIENR